MKCILGNISILSLLLITTLQAWAQEEEYTFRKVSVTGVKTIVLESPDHELEIKPLKKDANTYDRNMILDTIKYRWHFVKGKPSLLYREDSLGAALTDMIKIGDSVYNLKQGSTRRTWNYLQNGEMALACTYKARDGIKYIILDFQKSDNIDVLRVLALYYGQSVINNRSNLPIFLAIAGFTGFLRVVAQNQ